MGELATFLDALRRSPADNPTRLAFADWLDENYPATPVVRGVLPKGFNAHWHARHVGADLFVHFHHRRQAAGKWRNTEILQAFADADLAGGRPWFDHPGATEIGGYPVLVSEPLLDPETALRVCAALHLRVGRCPVSYSRQAARSEACVRIGIWFTAMPGAEQLTEEGMERLRRFPLLDPSGLPYPAPRTAARPPPSPAADHPETGG